MSLSKSYEPTQVEPKWYRFWTAQGYFHADAAMPRAPFCIVIPPPNVTGSLHLGHALDLTIQDLLVRWRRMAGYNAMWLPGTDHAGIATQVVVERELLRAEGKRRQEIGRQAFLERVWEWKRQYGGRISEQLRHLGASLDWARERFTMDEMLSRAVREVFVRLHEEGLIYRARRLINWCPRCATALSDLEVEHEEKPGRLWHIAYPVPGTATELVVATTRPETMLGDTAVAVHPDDERYRELIGRQTRLPLCERDIPVIADPLLVDREFGSGVVKVTPGHDFNDFECGLRNRLPQISIFDLAGRLNDNVPERFRGLTVGEAREAVVRELEAAGLLRKLEDHVHAIGTCQRCRTVVEPTLSLQWFVRMEPLARPAIAAVDQGQTRFVPESWTRVYQQWMHNIKDWCISRQLWWGHRIPAWHCEACGHATVAREAPAACQGCGAETLHQDEDVLDTWFSSALWPFSTLGWPEQTADLATFYPTSVMVTSYDILFFWVARMMMMGLHFVGDVPFRKVYLHALVVDKDGQKMSKVRGNVVDPLELTSRYGADALRLTLATLAAQGRSIRFIEDKEKGEKRYPQVEGYRHFANKLWNASRFVLINLEGFDPEAAGARMSEGPARQRLGLAERWILSRLQRVAEEVDAALEELRINDAALAIYRFVWHELCDWYIELAKPALYGKRDGQVAGQGDDAEAPLRRQRVQRCLALTLETTLRLLHPFLPFVTEEIWQQLPKPGSPPGSLMVTLYPVADRRYLDDEAEQQMALLMDVVTAVRNLRAEYNVPPGAQVEVVLRSADPGRRALLETHGAVVRELGKAGPLAVEPPSPSAPPMSVAKVLAEVEVLVLLGSVIDVQAERARLQKELGKLEGEIGFVEKKLGNQSFVERAPKDVVEKERLRLAELGERRARVQANLLRLQAAPRLANCRGGEA